jgi:glycosyltransferase involved in cell wall biosynthesis
LAASGTGPFCWRKGAAIRIAFFSKQLPSDAPNGVSVQAHRLAQALRALGHAVTCFSFSPAPAQARYEVRVLDSRAWSRIGRKLEPGRRFASIDTGPFDVAHYHGDDYLCPGSRRRVRTFYGSALDEALHAGRPGRALYQTLFYCLEWVSCLRKGTLAGISTATQRALPRVRTIIPCGVPLDRFTPGSSKTPHPSVIFMGDLHSRKRGNEVLKAFAHAVRPRFADARLTVIGPERCGGPGIDWKCRVDEQELIEEYRRAWVCCSASSYEGFGVPMIEAMACATPVVSAMNEGSGAIICNGVNGLLCTPRDLGPALCAALGDAPLRARLAEAGLQTARAYDVNTIARRYEEIYQTIAGRP